MSRRTTGQNERLVVQTEYGPVRGTSSDGVHTWRAIPYAAAPVGTLRWKAPQPPQAWTEPRDCTRFGPRSMQPATALWPKYVPVDAPVRFSEDSLILNVSTPDEPAPDGGWPVLFHVHGGGFTGGSPVEMGEGEQWPRSGIVLVGIQYRLGPFGFLDLSCLDSDESTSGVAGLLDVIAALHWTHRNIAAFGGDPGAITIHGGSAGAKAVGFLLASPLTSGVISRAVMCSGTGNLVRTADTAAEQTGRFLDALNRHRDTPVTNVEHLRGVDAADLLAASTGLLPPGRETWLWRPTLHPQVLPRVPVEALREGAAAGIDLLLGVCAREGEFFAEGDNRGHVLAAAASNIEAIAGAGRADEVVGTYLGSRPGLTREDAVLAAFGDAVYGIPTIRVADAQSRHARVWRYRLDQSLPGLTSLGLPRAHHGADAPILWGIRLPAGMPGVVFEDDADRIDDACRAFADAMRSFVVTGDPTTTTAIHWPVYDSTSRATLVVDVPVRVEHDPRAAERQVWGDADWIAGTWYPLTAPDSASRPIERNSA